MSIASSPSPSAAPDLGRDLRRVWASLDKRTRRDWCWLVPVGVAGTALDMATALLLLRLVAVVGGGEVPGHAAWAWLPASPGWCLGLIAGLVTAKTTLRLAETFWRESLSERTTAELARGSLARWLGAPLRLQLATPGPVMVDEVMSLASVAARDGIASLLLLISESLVVAGLGAVLVLAAPGPALVLLGLLGGLAGLALHYTHRSHARWGAAQVTAAPVLLGFVQGLVGGLREIRISGTAEAFLARFTPIREAFGRPQVHIDTWRQAPLFLLEALFIVGAGLLLWFMRGAGGLPLFVMAIYIGLRMLPAVNRVVYRVFALQNSRGALARIAGPEAEIPATPPAREEAAPVFARRLEVRDAVFTYPGATRPALRGASLVIPAGARVAIVGPSGHGKSTLLVLLAGLAYPDSGDVFCDEARLGVDDRRWHRLIGYVGQDTPLLDDTLLTNLTLGAAATGGEAALAAAIRAARLDEVVARLPLGLATPIGPNGRTLSGGERQRVALARAFYRRPRLLLLDEATAFLDPPLEQAVLASAAALGPETSVVFVTHRLAAARTADQVAFVRQGRVEDFGTYADLVARNPVFAAFADSVLESEAEPGRD